MKLSEAEVGNLYRVSSLKGQSAVKRRLRDMGITRGTTLNFHKVAPLGDPMQITVRGYELTLRKKDAEIIEVEKL